MEDRVVILARRAQRLRAEGEFRKACNAYGELTGLEPAVARWWVLLGVVQRAARRDDESAKALRQAAYLFHRAGDAAREHAVRRVMHADRPPLAA